MDEIYSEEMSSSDALIWRIERDPLLRSTIMTTWFLERPPTRERIRATVERAAIELPAYVSEWSRVGRTRGGSKSTGSIPRTTTATTTWVAMPAVTT